MRDSIQLARERVGACLFRLPQSARFDWSQMARSVPVRWMPLLWEVVCVSHRRVNDDRYAVQNASQAGHLQPRRAAPRSSCKYLSASDGVLLLGYDAEGDGGGGMIQGPERIGQVGRR